MLKALAATAWERPWALLGVSLALPATLAGIVALTGGGLGTGSDRLGAEGAETVVIAVDGDAGVRPRVAAVALETIVANVEADPAVSSLRRLDRPRAFRSALLIATLASEDGGEARAAVERLREEIDPGPLRVMVGGETSSLVAAGSSLLADLWRLELLALPLALVVLVALFGVRLALAAAICAASAVIGSVAGLGLGGIVGDPALLAAPAGIAVGLVVGLELAAILIARCEDQADSAAPREALEKALGASVTALGFLAGTAMLGSLALLASGYGPAGSVVLACGAASACAMAAAVLAVPPLYALELRSRARKAPGPAVFADSRLAAALAATPGFLAARDRAVPLVAGCALALLALVAVAASSVETRPLSGGAGGSLWADLPLVLGLGAAAVGAALVVRIRDPLGGAVAVLMALPVAAATAITALAFADGLSTAAAATLAASLLAIAGARSAAAVDAVALERGRDHLAAGVAAGAARLTMPAALGGTLAPALAAGALLGTDLAAARELGLGLIAGLLVDLVIVRPITLTLLAGSGAEPRRAAE